MLRVYFSHTASKEQGAPFTPALQFPVAFHHLPSLSVVYLNDFQKCVCLHKVHKSVFFIYMALEDWGPTSHNHDLFSDAPGVNSSSNLTEKNTKESNLRGSVTNRKMERSS